MPKPPLWLCVKPVRMKITWLLCSLASTFHDVRYYARRINFSEPRDRQIIQSIVLHIIITLFNSLFIYPKPSPIRHHGSPNAKHTAHVLLWSRLATHTLLSSQSFNIHRPIRIQALRSPSSIGLSDYSDEQF